MSALSPNDTEAKPVASPLAAAPAKAAALIEAKGLTRRFGGLTAVDAVDLAAAEGEFVSVIGPNGAGKTTLFNLITGLDRPDA